MVGPLFQPNIHSLYTFTIYTRSKKLSVFVSLLSLSNQELQTNYKVVLRKLTFLLINSPLAVLMDAESSVQKKHIGAIALILLLLSSVLLL